MIGFERAVGIPLLHGNADCVMPVEAVIEGYGFELQAGDFHTLLGLKPGLRQVLERYYQWRVIQMGMLALSGRQASVLQNVARVNLMLRDRVGHPTMQVTHEELARIVSARRPGVAEALHVLDGDGYLRSRRTSCCC
jgi:hypothetical protein